MPSNNISDRPAYLKNTFLQIQTSICDKLTAITGDKFTSDHWKYEKGEGGGLTKIISGRHIEKGGVNFSAVFGKMNAKIAANMKVKAEQDFFATGVSLVIHPVNPFVPTVHMNVRYFELSDRWWFGGGCDLTPYYPNIKDIKHFHYVLKSVCDDHDANYYPAFKRKCDEYFYLRHRNETRGVGGIFFDYLSKNWEKEAAFTIDVGNCFNQCYMPILSDNMPKPYAKQHKDFQNYRRGRYVEFNLLYDRGTMFGLETEGRVESILMSLPPLAAWSYNFKPTAGSPEAAIYQFLKPIDWID